MRDSSQSANRVSVVVLTKNEAKTIERCVRGALGWADEVLVLDSGSTDATREIAAGLGARVIEQPWLGWAAQRQRSITAAAHDWVFWLDADEIPDAELATAIRQTMLGNPDPRDGYNVVRRDEFFGRLLPNLRNRTRQHAFIRMFNRTHSSYTADQLIHEEVHIQGRSLPLPGVLVHWRNFTLAEQMSRYISNCALEAQQADAAGKRATALHFLFMPPLRFLWVFVAKGAWRLGMTGLVTASMMACAEFMRWAALWERQAVTSAPHPPEHVLYGTAQSGRSPTISAPFKARGRE